MRSEVMKNTGMKSRVTLDRVQHLVRVPVRVNDSGYRFLIDTGIGITVVSSAVAARSDVTWMNETFTGRRMSGYIYRYRTTFDVSGARMLLATLTAGSD
jgi:predicted aspartyl protease